MSEELFKKKISKEEKIYREAVELQRAVSCVLRFEQKAASLKSAARKFEKLEDYKDAKVRAEACRKAAAKAEREGSKEIFEEAVRRQEQAKDKSDYADAITEFRRVSKKDAYGQEAKERIQECKKKIARLETRAVWRRRLIVLVVVAGCAGIFLSTPLYPFAKGYAHQQMGQYEAALANYKEASSLSWTKDLSGVCYYKMGMQKLEQGEKKQALKLFRKAKKKGNQAAKKQIKKLKAVVE